MPRVKEQAHRNGRDGRGTRIEELRNYFGLQQSTFAKFFNKEQYDVSNWESGRRPSPLRAIAVTFGVSIDWLMGITDYKWNRTVEELRHEVYQRLLNLDENERETVLSPESDHTDRAVFLAELCQRLNPTLCTETYMLLLLGVTPEQFQAVKQKGATLNSEHYGRLADFLGIPAAWFETGNMAFLDKSQYGEYADVVAAAIAKGISPDRLALIVNAMS